MNIFDGKYRRILRFLYIGTGFTTGTPCFYACQRIIVRMLCNTPVNISVLRNITVKAVQNLLGAISVTGIQAFAPLLIQGNIYPGITVDT